MRHSRISKERSIAMKNHKRISRSLLPALAGALAFLFASVPLTLGMNVGGGDREFVDAQTQGFRTDARIADAIQSALEADASLSTDARNAKIITINGNVILRGTVATQDEKMRVEQIARSVAKAALVENNLEVQSR
jgi:hypothetical protein